MKMKEFGPRGGGRVPGGPLRSANEISLFAVLLAVVLKTENSKFMRRLI